MKNFLLLLILTVLSNSAFANSSSLNLQLPNASSNFSSDKFKAGDLDCQNAIGGSTNLEFGVTGLIDRNQNGIGLNAGPSTDVGVYARIVIPLGKRVKQRINCNRLFELAIREKALEVQRLETELKRLQQLQFED